MPVKEPGSEASAKKSKRNQGASETLQMNPNIRMRKKTENKVWHLLPSPKIPQDRNKAGTSKEKSH